MNRKNEINNRELSMYWDWLYDMEEKMQNTPFCLDSSVMEEVKKRLRQADAEVCDDSRPIKIVVTGRMKAGKSMMADVLFFGGDGVLGSDATPKTANITYIRCTDEQHPKEGARVSFLKKADVNEMEDYVSKQSGDGKSGDANAVADNERYRASKERLAEINKDPSKRDSLLDKDKWISLGELEKYSDSDGEFSDFVDQIEAYIDDPRLENLEVVDTPGLGDPVASRGQKAREESRNAEVVFYLSRASHFMDEADSDEFARLKKAGCKNMILIMSQFDEVYEPEGAVLVDLKDTARYDELVDDGKGRIQTAMKEKGMEYEPISIIPICALGAKLSRHELEKDDAFYRNKVSDLFPDLSDADAVYELSGMSRLQEEVEKAANEREQIREASNARKIQECRDEIIGIYQSLKKKIQNEIAMKTSILQKPDNAGKAKAALDKWEKLLQVRITTALSNIEEKIDKKCEKIKRELHNASGSTKDLMDKSTAPASINDAYETAFKNDVHDQFADGIEGRMQVSSAKRTYGEMFDNFESSLRSADVPKEIADIRGLSGNLYARLQDGFENRIRKDYNATLHKVMPIENINEILEEGYRAVRSCSSEFKNKKKLIGQKKRDETNADAIAKCKSAVELAESKVRGILDQYSDYTIRGLFEDIEDDLKTKLKAFIIGQKEELNENEKEQLEKDIQAREGWLAELAELGIAEIAEIAE